MAFSIRLIEEERKLADSYAQLHGIPLGEAFKQALFDRVEDEYDLEIAPEALDDFARGGYRSRAIEKLGKECDL